MQCSIVQSGEVVCECQPCWRLLLSTLQNAREGDQGSDRGVLPGEFGGVGDCNQRNIAKHHNDLVLQETPLEFVGDKQWVVYANQVFRDNYSSKEMKWCVLIR